MSETHRRRLRRLALFGGLTLGGLTLAYGTMYAWVRATEWYNRTLIP